MYNTNRKGSIYELTLPHTWEGQTIQEILTDTWHLPKKMVHEWRMSKAVKVNGELYRWNQPLSKGDILQVPFFSNTKQAVHASYIGEIDVLYEDDHLLVANKPAGVKTHPNDQDENDTLLNGLALHVESNGEQCFIRHIHRLDENTSGAVLFAKHEAAYALLSRLLEKRLIKRAYWAIVHGQLKNKEGVIKEAIGKDRHHPTRRRISPNGQSAVTHYQLLKKDPSRNLSFIKCQLETGRTHQIRVHLSSIGHPLAGDLLYGGKPIVKRQALHAKTIEIPHPFTGEQLVCEAPFTDDTFDFF
ncbi:23S rRNA pseudouridine1911/1915/1917 synthase [Bacillus ectoiniformans]|uniref:RluA family pseudouridine synthase n=1 Tax=Bacillus ectoiniformans TaxID=1494429 RepID=UPI00195DF211|nr:RluA family pseudouridine synthase [Bacillus ectoiniformans]MBM7647660.1 23S rRNA pseudouridine1911/1915/1917 synthase [Bacillus ectoiniformans]